MGGIMLSAVVTLFIVLVRLSDCDASKYAKCNISITTSSGSQASNRPHCSGELIFYDNFDKLDLKKWQHESTLTGGGVSTSFFHYNTIIISANFEICYLYKYMR